jgi:hypothetical protein
MAGRCVSVDRRALGTTRVMRTCGMMGEVVGKAAWIATNRKTSPRGVYQNYLPLLIDLIEKPGRARRQSLNAPLTIPPIPKGGLRGRPQKRNIINLKGLVFDDVKAKLEGSWRKGDGLRPHHGLGYQYAPYPASATYNIRVKDSGNYEVRVHWLNHNNRTTAAELVLTHARGTETIILDQTKTPAQKTYTSLGSFDFVDVLPAMFTVTSKAAGNLHIDAIQLLKSK